VTASSTSATAVDASTPLAPLLAAFAVSCRDDGVPDDVAASVRDRILDVLGLCLGARDIDTSVAIRTYARRQGGNGQAHAVGDVDSLPPALAALVNGTLAHSLDYDDTHLPSVLHPSASVVPAAFAAAESVGADGPMLVRAIAAGLEVCVRLGMAGYDESTGSSVYFEHGQHATSICGAIGGAVAAGLLRGLDADGITHAIGISSSMASGVIESNRTGGTVKRLHCGWAAHSAVTAAELVGLGFTGPPTVLEGRFGLFESFLHGQFDSDAVSVGLGTQWSVPSIFFKPYPANHFTHTIVDNGRALRERGIAPDQVATAEIGVPASVVRTVGEPLAKKQSPGTTYEAQFSGPYALAVGMFGGGGLGAALADYAPDLIANADRRALMARTTVVADEECTRIFPHQFPSVVSVVTTEGERVRVEALHNRGGTDQPLTAEELSTKFADNVAGVLSQQQIDAAVAAVHDLLDGGSVAEVMERVSIPSTPDD
jgi:2-methylcitrate dehydratase PrpD